VPVAVLFSSYFFAILLDKPLAPTTRQNSGGDGESDSFCSCHGVFSFQSWNWMQRLQAVIQLVMTTVTRGKSERSQPEPRCG